MMDILSPILRPQYTLPCMDSYFLTRDSTVHSSATVLFVLSHTKILLLYIAWFFVCKKLKGLKKKIKNKKINEKKEEKKKNKK